MFGIKPREVGRAPPGRVAASASEESRGRGRQSQEVSRQMRSGPVPAAEVGGPGGRVIAAENEGPVEQLSYYGPLTPVVAPPRRKWRFAQFSISVTA